MKEERKTRTAWPAGPNGPVKMARRTRETPDESGPWRFFLLSCAEGLKTGGTTPADVCRSGSRTAAPYGERPLVEQSDGELLRGIVLFFVVWGGLAVVCIRLLAILST